MWGASPLSEAQMASERRSGRWLSSAYRSGRSNPRPCRMHKSAASLPASFPHAYAARSASECQPCGAGTDAFRTCRCTARRTPASGSSVRSDAWIRRNVRLPLGTAPGSSNPCVSAYSRVSSGEIATLPEGATGWAPLRGVMPRGMLPSDRVLLRQRGAKSANTSLPKRFVDGHAPAENEAVGLACHSHHRHQFS